MVPLSDPVREVTSQSSGRSPGSASPGTVSVAVQRPPESSHGTTRSPLNAARQPVIAVPGVRVETERLTGCPVLAASGSVRATNAGSGASVVVRDGSVALAGGNVVGD